MLTYFARRLIRAFEARWSYDAAYLREVLDGAGLAAFLILDGLNKISKYRRDVPVAVYYAAKTTAAIAADCGTCAQLVFSMAQAEGVDIATLSALAAGERSALPPEEQLGFDLARATLARIPSDDVRRAIVRRWGRRGLLSIAYALVSAQAFPTLKYALGYGHACTRLRAGDVDLPRQAEFRS